MSTTLISAEITRVTNFEFSQLFKDFNCKNANLFVFENASLILTPGSTTTSTFRGDLKMEGILAPFKSLLESSETISLTASIETTTSFGEKISPKKLTLISEAPFHIPLFNGVTLIKTYLQLVMEKDDNNWIFTPSLVGILDVDGITDVDEEKIKVQVLLENHTLKLSAKGKNLNGPFGLSQLMLDEISITGMIGAEKKLIIASVFEVGTTTFNFNGLITPEAVGMMASAKNFTLNELANLFIEIAPGNLKLPDFDVDFKNTSIAFATEDCKIGEVELEKGLTLATDLTAHGHTISATAELSSNGVEFTGSVGNVVLGPVSIKEAGLKFDIYKKAANKASVFTIYGETEIQNVSVDAGIYFEKQASTWETLLYANVEAQEISLSTFFPETKDSVMDQLSLSKMTFVFATADCSPQALPAISSVKKGLQLMATVEEIPGLSELVGNDDLAMELTAHIGDTVDITVALPDTRLDLGKSVTTDPFKIALIIAPQPSIALIFGMEVSIPNQTQPLHFNMMLDISAIEATGSVTMKNYWRNPFGINGLKIGPEVAMQLGINYVQFASTGTPSTFGLAGGLAIGNTIMDMAVNISTNPMDEILSGSLKELDLKEIVVFTSDVVGIDLPEDEIPDFLDIKNLQFYVAPAGGNIGTITYEKGMSFSCDMVFFGKEFEFYTRISDAGIEGAGKIDAIDLGPLKISGEKGEDMTVDLELTTEEMAFSMDGAISFLGAKKGVYVSVSNQGIEFMFEENFFNLLKFQIEGKSSGSITKPESLDFQLEANMQNDITSYLKNTVAQKIDDAIDDVNEDIDDAQKKVDEAEKAYKKEYDKAEKALNKARKEADELLDELTGEVNKAKASYNKEVGKAQKELDKAEAAYNKAFNSAKNGVATAEKAYNSGIATARAELAKAEREYNKGISTAKAELTKAENAYKKTIGSAQKAVDSAQRKVNSLKKDIKKYTKKLKNLSWTKAYKAPGYTAKIAALSASYGTATAALTAAKGVLEGVKQTGSYAAFKSAKLALEAAKTGAKFTAFQAAKTSLQVAKTGAKYTAFEGAKATLTAVQKGTEYTAWEAAEETLAAVKKAGSLAISAANKSLNEIGKSAAYVALNAAKLALNAVEEGTAAVAFGSAKASLEAAKLGSTAVLSLAEEIAKHAGDVFDVKSMHLSASLKGIENGDLFKADMEVAILSKNYNWHIDLNIQDVTAFIDELFKKAFNEAKDLVGL